MSNMKTETTYYLPNYWRAWWYTPIRSFWLRRWRNQGFAYFEAKRRTHLAGYQPVDRFATGHRMKQGIAFAYVNRVRRSGGLIVTKPILTDQAIREVVT